MALSAQNIRLPPEVNRILYVKNLPYNMKADELYDLFGRYGPIRQIRIGDQPTTKGSAFVIYEDIYDARNALERLQGFKVLDRFLVVQYFRQRK
jgi:RNA recognition motif-containing protein